MTLVIELTPGEEARLEAAAAQRGVEPAELARSIMAEHLPQVADMVDIEMDPTLRLFADWDREDAQMTPEEQEEARREFEAFKASINAERERAGARRVYG